MGGELVNSSTPGNDGGQNKSAPRTFTQMFEDVLPFYLSIGVSWELFWDGDPTAVIYYRKSYEMQKEVKNNDYWLQGAYIYDIMSRLFPLYNPMVKRNTKPGTYIDAPYPLTTTKKKEVEAEEEKRKFLKIQDKFASFIQQNNKRFKKGE